MKKLSTLTKEELNQSKIFPIDVEDYTVETINDIYGETKLLNRYEYNHGRVLRDIDEVLFTAVCGDIIDGNISDKTWIEIDGYYYDREEVIRRLEELGFEIEDDN